MIGCSSAAGLNQRIEGFENRLASSLVTDIKISVFLILRGKISYLALNQHKTELQYLNFRNTGCSHT